MMKVKPKEDVKNVKENESVFIRLDDVPFDMLRYNISMQSGVERRETRKALLLKMGAKKPKNAYVNYKELMQERAKSKLEAQMYPVDRASNFVNRKIPLKKTKKKGKKKKKEKKNKSHPKSRKRA